MRLLTKIFIVIVLNSLFGCVSIQQFSNKKRLSKSIEKNELLKNHFTGLAIYDLETKSYLYEKDADKYFVPASNTKLLTFYASLISLRDSTAGLKYEQIGDSLYISGSGDPTFLHPDFKDQPVLEFLSQIPDSVSIIVINDALKNRFGSGWAWDDFQYSFQPELSNFPVHGNFVTIERHGSNLEVDPIVFKDLIELDGNHSQPRNENYNYFYFNGRGTKTIPFITSNRLVSNILSDTLNRKVHYLDTTFSLSNQIKYRGAPLVYHKMLKASDNFMAEQLLLMSAQAKGFAWNTNSFIQYIKSTKFKAFQKKPIWKDGSGLSRYNLITPRNLVNTLILIQEEIGLQKAKNYLPAGGVSGTIKGWYKADQPYVFAKTGTLSNIHCLSGYLETDSGKTLVFSFMNNNYPSGASVIKKEMETVLRVVKENY